MNKKLGIRSVIYLACGLPLLGGELRTIDGKVVDLTPVQQWLQSRTGERPLPDWKQLRILDIKPDTSGAPRCSVKTEGGQENDVRIKNLPPEVRTLFWKKEQVAAHIEALKKQTAARERALKQANTEADKGERTSTTNAADLKAPDPATDKAEERMRQERIYVDMLRDQQNTIVAAATNITTVLAVATGKKEDGLEVWDCGTPVPSKQ